MFQKNLLLLFSDCRNKPKCGTDQDPHPDRTNMDNKSRGEGVLERIHCVTFWKTVIFVVTTMRTSKAHTITR
jgi:hypothetical protein